MEAEHEDGWEDDDAPADTSGQAQPAVPEGRRVVRRKKRKGGGSRATSQLKSSEILRDLEGEEVGPMNVREQVQRLKETRKDDAPLEDRWGSRRHRRRGTRWILFMVLLVVAPLVIAIVYVAVSGNGGGSVTPARQGSIFDELPEGRPADFDPTSPETWFHENSVQAFDVAIELLERWNEAEEPDELADMLRDSSWNLPEIRKTWAARSAPYFLDDPRTLTWEYGGAGDTGFMAIVGRRTDHRPFRAYFVKTDEGLKLDWEASSARSTIAIGDLAARAPKQPTVVRCWLGKQPDYDVFEGLGSLSSWYRILDPGREKFVWASVPAGSKLDESLKKLLNYGMMVMERKDEVRVMVRLVKPTVGFRDTEFEILEVVTEDWVLP